MIKGLIVLRIRNCIRKLQRLSLKAHHETMEDAADRGFIRDYVLTSLPYICPNPEILEFDGGVVYADEIIREKGGSVEYATKKGRTERCNRITYEFDIRYERIDKEFDLIIATQILGGFINPTEIMKRLYSMLKKNGVLVVTVSGPTYPSVRGLVSFYSKEGLIRIGREVFGAKNVKNVRSYGDFASAIGMMNYLTRSISNNLEDCFDYKHEVINGITCTKND